MNSGKIHVCVDLDGVVAGFDEYICQRFADTFKNDETVPPEIRHGIPLNEREIYWAQAHYGQYGDKYSDWVEQIVSSPGFFRNLPVIPGAIKAMNEMDAHPAIASVYICTKPKSNFENCVLEKYEWVREHLGNRSNGDPWTNHIIMTHDKTRIICTFLIDDEPPLIRGDLSPTWRHIVFDRPYNQKSHIFSTMRGWEDWKRALQLNKN